MRVEDVPSALRRQLGPEATDGLLGTLDQARREWTEDVMSRSAGSFERRLIQEMSGLRVEFRETLALHRAEFREALAAHRSEFKEALAAQSAELRELIAVQGAELRTAIAEQGAVLRSEIAASRADILRWLFIFWTGQIVALAALLNVLL
jgi:hypothetical protein